MAKLDLASSEWCQLIFEGKNQAYGAYRCVLTRLSAILSQCWLWWS